MKELRITPIKNGTVIDHIKPGMALQILKLLGISGQEKKAVSVAMYALSKKEGFKDIIKIEDKELKPREVNRLAILAPNSTISIIRNFKVVKKFRVRLPEVVEGIVRCENLNCITNQREPVETKMVKAGPDLESYRCYYCGRIQNDMEDHII
ncbi:MAG: aspartate carbamoyltransferase regulatory subunit [Thermoplasmatota archaeon]